MSNLQELQDKDKNMNQSYNLRYRHTSLPNLTSTEDTFKPSALPPVQGSPNADIPEPIPPRRDTDIPVIKMSEFQQVDMNEKLDLIMAAMNKIPVFIINLKISTRSLQTSRMASSLG